MTRGARRGSLCDVTARKSPKPRGLAALLPDSVLRGAAAAARPTPIRAALAAPDEAARRMLRGGAAGRGRPKALPAAPAQIAVVAHAAGVLVDEAGRLPALNRMRGACVMLVALPSGRTGAVGGPWGDAPKGLRWAHPRDLCAEDLADALAAAPGLGDLAALTDAEIAAQAVLEAAGVAPADLAGLRADEVLRLVAERLRGP